MPVFGVTFNAKSIHYLPPIQAADNTYATNLDETGAPLTEDYMHARKEKLLEIFDTLNPDLILIEAYPFGRRVVHQELKEMLQPELPEGIETVFISSVAQIGLEELKDKLWAAMNVKEEK